MVIIPPGLRLVIVWQQQSVRELRLLQILFCPSRRLKHEQTFRQHAEPDCFSLIAIVSIRCGIEPDSMKLIFKGPRTEHKDWRARFRAAEGLCPLSPFRGGFRVGGS